MHTYAEYVKKGKTFLGTKPNERLTVCMAHLFYSRTKQANVFTWRIDLSNRPNNFFHSFVLCTACFFLSLHPFKVIVAYFLVRVVRCWFFYICCKLCTHRHGLPQTTTDSQHHCYVPNKIPANLFQLS